MTPLLENAIRASCENVPPCDYPTCGCEFEPTRIKVAIAAALADDEATVAAVCAMMEDETAWTPQAERVRKVIAALRRNILGDQA